MDSENFIEDLKPYGILAREGCEFNLPEEAKIKISYATIESIDFDVLQEKGIKELTIGFSKISNIKFSNQNDLRIYFFKCNFLEQVFALECNFEKEVEFVGCNFEKEVYFSGVKFQDKASFDFSRFKDETFFIETQFLAKQKDNKTIENSFIGTFFEKRVFFNKAKFQSKVSFQASRFKDETFFIQTQFLAKQKDNKTIENSFIGTFFEKRVFFNKAKFQSKVSFQASRFKDETFFIETQFLAKQNDIEAIANGFQEIIFENKVSFIKAEFQAKTSFYLSKFQDEVRFWHVKFLQVLMNQKENEIIENSFIGTFFEKRADFSEAIFKTKVSFQASRFKDEAKFIGAKFSGEQQGSNDAENNFREAFFEKRVSFARAEFKARINFSLLKFKGGVRFIDTVFESKNFIFEDVEFYHAEFISSKKEDIESDQEQNYHFKNVIFKDVTSFENLNISELNFENVIFNNIVVFKDVNFVLNHESKINKPNFINCTFSNQFNIEHKYIQYDFDEIKAKINSDTEKNYKNLLNYRDLFRKLKSNRIAHHNQIDASELRTQELYARELELEHKKDKSLKEKIERWQLIFYKNLCDHHTDLILNLKWLIIVIGLFASLYFILQVIQNFDIFLALNKYGLILSLTGFILITIVYYFQDIKKFDFFACVASILVLNVICYKPKLIFGIANLIGDNTHNGFENFLFTVYTIIIGLVVFSLQKTARKNSIVPS
ncbi:hypothetical protein [Campylobacter molothri]|uniref:hypothetical protein n=1 Tax=Campylobacter molothri TaxID=1032242 RepID=UPI001DCA0B7E|nr:pentapeptide repeat-containing protein [Campylobacter sp. RM9759]